MNCNEFRKHQILAEEEGILPSDARLHLAGCSECQTYLREQERLRVAVRKLAASEHAPALLHESIAEMCTQGGSRVRKQQGTRRWVTIAAAIVAMVGTGAGYLWYLQARTPSPERLATEFITDHLHYLPGHEQIVSASAQEVERWLQGQVDFPVRVPELRGAALEEGRICSVAGRRAALLHYRRRPDGVLVSLFVAPAAQKLGQQETASLLKTTHLGCNAALWYHRGLAYGVVATLDDPTMQQIADSVRQQQP